jgi:dipeptidyl aminopeptidase/acylaminoacyl peptidase
MMLISASMLLACIAQATTRPVVIRDHEALALAPAGDRVADVESLDPGNLSEEAHGAVVVHAADGKLIAQYDPCKTCKYSDAAWSPKGDALAFVATDATAGKTTLDVVDQGATRTVTTIAGVANTVRWSPDGLRIALLVTSGAHKKTGAIEAGAAQVGEIGVTEDEQRIAVVPANGGELKSVSPADTYIYEYDWTPDGSGFVATGAKGNGDNNWWIATLDYIDAVAGGVRVIAAPRMQMNLPRVSRDGETVAFVGGLMTSTPFRSRAAYQPTSPRDSRAHSAESHGADRA